MYYSRPKWMLTYFITSFLFANLIPPLPDDDGFWIEKITLLALTKFSLLLVFNQDFFFGSFKETYGNFNYMWGCVSESEIVAVNKNLQKSSIVVTLRLSTTTTRAMTLATRARNLISKLYLGQTSVKKAKNYSARGIKKISRSEAKLYF